MTTASLKNSSTKEQLLKVATVIFAQKGYEDATLREICAAAGANNAAINYHFGGKRELYLEALRAACRDRAIIEDLPERPEGTPPAVRIRDFIRLLVEHIFDESKTAMHTRLMLREMGQPTEATEDLARNLVRPDFEHLMGILDEMFGDQVTAKQKRLIIFSIVGQCLHYRIAQPLMAILVPKKEFQSYNADLIADHICRFTLAALGAELPLGHSDSTTR